MDWEDLRVFIAFARAGSLSAAARQLRLDHTTVSRRIAALEAGLEMKLIDRLQRGARLTADGDRLAALAGVMEDTALAVERLARQTDGALSGSVRISAPPYFAASFIAPRLGPLRVRHPGLTLDLSGEPRTVSLPRHEADIAIRLMRPEGNSLVARRIGLLGYRLYGARSYLACTPRPDWAFVGFDESLDHLPQQRWLRQVTEDRPLVLRSNEQAVQMAAIVAGLGVGVLPCCFVSPAFDLERLPVEPDPPPRELWLAVHADLLRSPKVRAVFDFLAGMAAAEAPLLLGA